MLLFSFDFHHIDDLSLQDRQTFSFVEQRQIWKDIPKTCPIAGSLRLFVPQRMYQPHMTSDRRHYAKEVRLSPPIIFEVEHPAEWGIALDDALKLRNQRLLDKNASMFEGFGPSVSIRLEVCLHFAYFIVILNPYYLNTSGQVHLGVGRFLLWTFRSLHVPSRRPSWPRPSRSVFNV